MLYWILIVLLVVGFISLWVGPYGRTLFDVAVFITVLVLLLGMPEL